MSSGASAEVMGEDALRMGAEEADEAEGGVEAATGTCACGARPCTTVKRRKRWNVDDKRIDLIATTVNGALLSFEPNGRGRARRDENSAVVDKNGVPILLGSCCTCGARIGGTLLDGRTCSRDLPAELFDGLRHSEEGKRSPRTKLYPSIYSSSRQCFKEMRTSPPPNCE